jgi:hypothetical protein
MEIAALQRREEYGYFARLDEDRQRKIWSAGHCGPLPRAALQTGIGCLQIFFGYDTEHMGGGVGLHFHPSHNIGAARHLPFVDVRTMAEIFELMPDPECTIAISRRVTDENIRHARHSPIDKASWL